jgi:hypothetical protein
MSQYTQKFNKQTNQQINRRKESPNDIRSALERSERTHEASEITDKKVYITVPYDDRTTAKMLGAKWDDEFKSWYVLDNFENYQQLIRRYPYVEKTYLYVSYDDKDIAKSMGAYYCGVNKRWYAPRPQEQTELIKRFGSLPKVNKGTDTNRHKKSIQPILRSGTNPTENTKLLQPESPNEVEITV